MKPEVVLLSQAVEQCLARIRILHNQHKVTSRTHLAEAVALGDEFKKMQALAEHGEFEKALNKCGFVKATVYRYMKLSDHKAEIASCPSVTHAFEIIDQPQNGAAPKAAKPAPKPVVARVSAPPAKPPEPAPSPAERQPGEDDQPLISTNGKPVAKFNFQLFGDYLGKAGAMLDVLCHERGWLNHFQKPSHPEVEGARRKISEIYKEVERLSKSQ